MSDKPTHEELEQRVRDLENEFRDSMRTALAINHISNVFLTVPDKGMYEKVLEIVLETLSSEYGVFGYIDPNGDLICPSMIGKIWNRCQMPDKDFVFPRSEWRGLWGRALLEKKILYSNTPFSPPEGHVPIHRALLAPIVFRDETIGFLPIANKKTDYTEDDLILMERITDNIAPVLNARLQRDQQERERRIYEDSLRKAQEIAGLGNWEWDIAKDTIRWSDQIYSILGVSPEDFQPSYENLRKMIHPDDRAMHREMVNNAVAGKGKHDFEYRVIRPDGRMKVLYSRAEVVRDADGTPIIMRGITQDITKHKQAERALLASEAALEIEKTNLEDSNTALRVLLRESGATKEEIERDVLENAKNLLLPYVAELESGLTTEKNRFLINIIKSNIDEITSSFSRKISERYNGLTPREIQVADLVRQGRTNKEIGRLLNISPSSVDFHRRNLRKKFNIKGEKVNLRSHLLTFVG